MRLYCYSPQRMPSTVGLTNCRIQGAEAAPLRCHGRIRRFCYTCVLLEYTRPMQTFSSDSAVWAYTVAFASGVATSLTPCVYPMIPITVSIFGAKKAASRGTAFLLATAYVMGIALTYTALGLAAAAAGWASAGAWLSSPLFVWPLCVLFFALALSMFGIWDLRIPATLQNRMATVGGQGAHGAFAMGLVGGVLIAPCTGPWLAGLLAYVATTNSILFGGSLLFSYALGIGALFWIIATFAVSLPKSGRWLENIKSALGIPLLVAALYYLQNVVEPLSRYTSAKSTFAALNVGVLLAGLVSGAIHVNFRNSPALARWRKCFGIVLLAIGGLGLVNFALHPRGELRWLKDEKRARATAKQDKRPLLVDFWATWCVPCREIEAGALSDARVRRQLSRFVLLKVDVSHDTADDRKLKTKYHALELPQLIVFDSSGREAARWSEPVAADKMLPVLRRVR